MPLGAFALRHDAGGLAGGVPAMARKAARTKGSAGRSAAAKKAAKTRARHRR